MWLCPFSNDYWKVKLQLVDLAGSERIKKTRAEGQRLKEGKTQCVFRVKVKLLLKKQMSLLRWLWNVINFMLVRQADMSTLDILFQVPFRKLCEGMHFLV